MKEKHQTQSSANSNCLPKGNRRRRSNQNSKFFKNNSQPKTLNQELSFSKNHDELYNKISTLTKFITEQRQDIIIRTDKKLFIEKLRPNISITISHRYPHTSEINSYNRDEVVARLNRQSAVFIRKFLLLLMPGLKMVPYEEWPPFMAFMEHFDEEGKLRAPHYHIVIRVPEEYLSFIMSEDFINFWKKEWSIVVRDLDQDLVHIEKIESDEVAQTAIYVTKNFLRDGNEDSNIKFRRAYGWSASSLSSIDWYFDNHSFRKVLMSKESVRQRKPKSHSQRMEEKANFEKVSENVWDTAKPYDQVWSSWNEMAPVPRKKYLGKRKLQPENFEKLAATSIWATEILS